MNEEMVVERQITRSFLGRDKEGGFYSKRNGNPVEVFQHECHELMNVSLLDDLDIMKGFCSIIQMLTLKGI